MKTNQLCVLAKNSIEDDAQVVFQWVELGKGLAERLGAISILQPDSLIEIVLIKVSVSAPIKGVAEIPRITLLE